MAETDRGAKHDAFYEKRKKEVEDAILSLFETDGVHMPDVIGKDRAEDRSDLEKLVAFAMRHGDCEGAARMTLLAAEWLQVCNEIHEHE